MVQGRQVVTVEMGRRGRLGNNVDEGARERGFRMTPSCIPGLILLHNTVAFPKVRQAGSGGPETHTQP